MKRMLTIAMVGLLVQPLVVIAEETFAEQIANVVSTAVSTSINGILGQSLSAADQTASDNAIAELKKLTPAATTHKEQPTAKEQAATQSAAIQTLSSNLKSGTPVTPFTEDQTPVARVDGKVGGIKVTRPNDASSWAEDKAAALVIEKKVETDARDLRKNDMETRVEVSKVDNDAAINKRKTEAEDKVKTKIDSDKAKLVTKKAEVELANADLKVKNDALIADKKPIPNNYNDAFKTALAENKARVAAGLEPNPIVTTNFYIAPARKPRNRAYGFN